MSVRIVDVREITKPISSPIRNAYIDFTKMTTSLVAVVTDATRDGKRLLAFGDDGLFRFAQRSFRSFYIFFGFFSGHPKSFIVKTSSRNSDSWK